MKKKMILAGALALCLTLSACGSQAPSLEEVEAAIEDVFVGFPGELV